MVVKEASEESRFLETGSKAMGVAALHPSHNSPLSARAGKGVKKMITRICLLAILSMLLLVVRATEGFSAAAKDPEEIWQELGKLPTDERQKRLVAGARAEGKAILYGNVSADHLERLRSDFDKRYNVKRDGYRASGERVANRLLTEARGRKLDADVMAPSNEHIPALIKAGVAGRYDSPERAAFPETHKDRLGYWAAYD